ncbi:ABC-2 type transport system ATP-binding protein [Catenuloplanes nepalensis]|uniref:ABC-2 type transport system ATP-binding protein n=1 Tax=Catenuloplanes nepalensis TaxID=587533 RepID=A0ABT9MQB7_9ACTN|nr:ATP-binding cassette domain-containing protein [Catenuloplanes nepalensis]MDP9793612.1 ABC-2 type transport system ATP-binding protein [Catenuloplanes nepalensis]
MRVCLDRVSQGYGSTQVIDGLTLDLRPEVIGLLGPNGAGKTTLLRTMATIMPPRAGSLSLDDRVVTGERAARAVRSSIGYLPQKFGFDPGMRVLDFVRYAAWMRGVPAGRWDGEARRALEHVDLWDRAGARMKRLSGGMRQRAGIAWAIVGAPGLILLDEPTVGLDPRQRLQFRKIISGLRDSVVVLSTHLIDDIEAICDRVVVMHGGAIKFNGSTGELARLSRPGLPGNSDLERAYMSLLPEEEQVL